MEAGPRVGGAKWDGWGKGLGQSEEMGGQSLNWELGPGKRGLGRD